MELSIRLKTITDMMDKCYNFVDVGTDHGYVPIFAVRQGITERAVASDINLGPVERAKNNILKEGLGHKICCRKGPGLSTVAEGEVQAAVIAGMGGNLIRDIILEDLPKVKKMKYVIVQPAQNPEVLREFLYTSKFEVLKENLCIDEGKYYELLKIRYNEHKPQEKANDLDYEISPYLMNIRHPLMLSYITHKIDYYTKIVDYIKEDTDISKERKSYVKDRIIKLEEMKKWLLSLRT